MLDIKDAVGAARACLFVQVHAHAYACAMTSFSWCTMQHITPMCQMHDVSDDVSDPFLPAGGAQVVVLQYVFQFSLFKLQLKHCNVSLSGPAEGAGRRPDCSYICSLIVV